MNKTNRFWLVLATVTTLAITGCGLEETGAGDGTDGMNGDAADQQDPGSDQAPDAGAGGTDTGTTAPADGGGAPSTGDAGGAPDAGAPAPDAGSPTPDAGTPTPDAGSPTPDAGTPTPDAGSPTPDAGTPASGPAPVRSPASCQLRFADDYIGGAVCGQVRGNLPGATWSSGQALADTNADGELELTLTVAPAGTYDLTYVSAACPSGPAVTETWASYGSRAQLLAMTEDARSFVSCNWWNAATGMTVSVESPGCNLRITIDASCNVTGAGNMRNYH